MPKPVDWHSWRVPKYGKKIASGIDRPTARRKRNSIRREVDFESNLLPSVNPGSDDAEVARHPCRNENFDRPCDGFFSGFNRWPGRPPIKRASEWKSG